jgi:O-antigen/teichoic acid export membrane protein
VVTIRSTLINAAEVLNRIPRFVVLADQGLVSATNFATAVIIGRACGKPELGIYALAWTLLTGATESSATLTTTPYAVFGPLLSAERRPAYRGSIVVHQLLLSTAFALALGVSAAVSLSQGWFSEGLARVMLTTGIAIVFGSLREVERRVSFAELRVGSALGVDVITCMGQAAGLWFLLHLGALSAGATYTLIGLTSAAVGISWLALHRSEFHLDMHLCIADAKRNWGLAKWVLGSWIVGAVGTYTYPWLLAAFHGTSATGIWAACSGIVGFGNPVVLGLSNHVGPQIHNTYANSGADAMRRQVHRAGLQFVALLAPFVLLIGFGGERVVIGIYGKSYAGTGAVVTLLALNLAMTALTLPYARGLFSLERAKLDTFVNVAAIGLLFTIGIAAAKYYGPAGAAAALLASGTITTLIRISVFIREVRQRILPEPLETPAFAIESCD